MSLWSKLFGGGSDKGEVAPSLPGESHNGFTVFPEPMKEGGHWRVGARIEREIGGELRIHQMIRADTAESAGAAAAMSLIKAKRMIDEQGEGIFR